MTDIALQFDASTLTGDIAIYGGDVVMDGGLRTEVLMALFCDRRAEATDPLPDGGTDRRGWWADTFAERKADVTGSRLWLLTREKQLPEVVARARHYAQEALQRMVEDKVAKRVDVQTEVTAPGTLGMMITIERLNGTIWTETWKFEYAD